MNLELLKALDEARFAVVEAPAGLWWRVQRVTSEVQARVGISQLRMVHAAGDIKPAEGESAESIGAKAIANASDSDVDRMLKASTAKLMAGLVGVSQSKEGPFTKIQIVEDRKRDVANGLLAVADVPGSAVSPILDAIDGIDDPTGEAARRLGAFLG